MCNQKNNNNPTTTITEVKWKKVRDVSDIMSIKEYYLCVTLYTSAVGRNAAERRRWSTQRC